MCGSGSGGGGSASDLSDAERKAKRSEHFGSRSENGRRSDHDQATSTSGSDSRDTAGGESQFKSQQTESSRKYESTGTTYSSTGEDSRDGNTSASGLARNEQGDSHAHRIESGEQVKRPLSTASAPETSGPGEAAKLGKAKPKGKRAGSGNKAQGLKRYKAANAGNGQGSSNKLGGIPKRRGAGR